MLASLFRVTRLCPEERLVPDIGRPLSPYQTAVRDRPCSKSPAKAICQDGVVRRGPRANLAEPLVIRRVRSD